MSLSPRPAAGSPADLLEELIQCRPLQPVEGIATCLQASVLVCIRNASYKRVVLDLSAVCTQHHLCDVVGAISNAVPYLSDFTCDVLCRSALGGRQGGGASSSKIMHAAGLKMSSLPAVDCAAILRLGIALLQRESAVFGSASEQEISGPMSGLVAYLECFTLGTLATARADSDTTRTLSHEAEEHVVHDLLQQFHQSFNACITTLVRATLGPDLLLQTDGSQPDALEDGNAEGQGQGQHGRTLGSHFQRVVERVAMLRLPVQVPLATLRRLTSAAKAVAAFPTRVSCTYTAPPSPTVLPLTSNAISLHGEESACLPLEVSWLLTLASSATASWAVSEALCTLYLPSSLALHAFAVVASDASRRRQPRVQQRLAREAGATASRIRVLVRSGIDHAGSLSAHALEALVEADRHHPSSSSLASVGLTSSTQGVPSPDESRAARQANVHDARPAGTAARLFARRLADTTDGYFGEYGRGPGSAGQVARSPLRHNTREEGEGDEGGGGVPTVPGGGTHAVASHAVTALLHPLARHSKWTAPFVFPEHERQELDRQVHSGVVNPASASSLRTAIAQGHPPPRPEWTVAYAATYVDADWAGASIRCLLDPALDKQPHAALDWYAPWQPGPEDVGPANPLEGLSLSAAAVARACVYAGVDRRMQCSLIRMLCDGGRWLFAQAALRTCAARNSQEAGGDDFPMPGDEDLCISVDNDGREEEEIEVGMDEWEEEGDGLAQGTPASLRGTRRLLVAWKDVCPSSATRSEASEGPALHSATSEALGRSAVRSDGYWRPHLCIIAGGAVATPAPANSGIDTPYAQPVPVRLISTLGRLSLVRENIEAELQACGGEAVIVGIDAEWRPSGMYFDRPPFPPTPTGRNPSSSYWPVSVLQLATHRGAWVVDMLALFSEATADPVDGAQGHSPLPLRDDGTCRVPSSSVMGLVRLASALSSSVGWVLRNPLCVKAGYGVEGDMERLAATWAFLTPQCLGTSMATGVEEAAPWFAAVSSSVLDLRSLLPKACSSSCTAPTALVTTRRDTRSVRASPHYPHSLSHALESVVLGGLDKTHQTSDWQARPLTEEQVRYAATDALAAVAVAWELRMRVDARARECSGVDQPGAAWNGILQSCCTSWAACRSPSFPHVARDETRAMLASWTCRPLAALDSLISVRRRLWRLEPCPLDSMTLPSPERAQETGRSDGADNIATGAEAVACLLRAHSVDPASHLIRSNALNAGGLVLHLKTLALWAGLAPCIAILPADRRLDMAVLSAAAAACVPQQVEVNVRPKPHSHHRVRLATPEECVTTWGYAPGVFPPIGLACEHASGYTAFVDASVELWEETLVAGGGALGTSLAIPWPTLAQCLGTSFRVLPLTVESCPSQQGDPAPAEFSSGEPCPLVLPMPRPAFLLDGMLGRLTRWLRVIGVDAESTSLSGPGAAEWARLHPCPNPTGKGHGHALGQAGSGMLPPSAVLAWAATSGRIVLTRDRKLLARRGMGEGPHVDAPVWWVAPNDTHAQFEAVTNHFGLTVRPQDLMARCAKCNGLGYEHVGREVAVASKDVPAKVCAGLDTFWRCYRCKKLYWEGAKFEDTRGKFWALFQGE